MVTFWERSARSVNHMCSVLCLFVDLVVSHLGFEDGSLFLIVTMPGHCFPLLYKNTLYLILEKRQYMPAYTFHQPKKSLINNAYCTLSPNT